MTHYGRITLYSSGILLSLVLLSACSPYPPSDFYEVDGLVSIDAVRENEPVNWREIHYLNSIGMVSNIQNADSSFSMNFSFYLSNPGTYSFWLLTTDSGLPDETNKLDITVLGPDGFLVNRFQLEPPDTKRLQWITFSPEDQNEMWLQFRESGMYEVRINSGGNYGFQVHKIHLAYNDYLKPEGLGLPSSITPEINAADLFREQLVMLPPDWMFGLVTGSINQDQQSFSDRVDEEYRPVLPDAYWTTVPALSYAKSILSEIENHDIVPGFKYSETEDARSLYDMGYQFSVSRDEVSLNQTEEMFSAQHEAFQERERGIFLRDIHHTYNPMSKQYPALMTQPVQFSWSADATIRGNTFYPGGLEQMVETFSNPELSTYNIPYLSIPVVIDENPTAAVNNPDELMARTLQLIAFLPITHILYQGSPSKLHDGLSEENLEILRRYTDLRSILFPYIYTHAHFTRQTGQSLIDGFRNHANQFRFGDAFLVAPIVEANQLERAVYFPGDGSWYNFDTGRRYASGQSWIVDAPINRIPLFVKAGSVIPYRMETGQIRKGSNDLLRVEIYTGDAGTFRLTEDDGITRDYRRAVAARTMFRYNEVEGRLRLTIGAVQHYYEGMSDTRSYQLHFKHTGLPQEVLVNNEVIKENMGEQDAGNRYWYYDAEMSAIIIDLENQSKHERIEISITP